MVFKIGTIVSLKSNGLLPAANYNFLSLGGNENFSTPLMVIVEILFGTQAEIDEETGTEKLSEKGKNKYKCLYFSNKSLKFEDAWFHEKELLMYDEADALIHNNPQLGDIKWGDIVRFKTVDEESSKKKSFNNGLKYKASKPLLTFTSPAFQVVGFTNVDKKEPIIDPYNGKKKREKSQKLVKCKFFNFELSKFSEQLVPIECLQKVDNSKLEQHLKTISRLISNKELSIIVLQKDKYFGRPISVHSISGRYQLVIWNELEKKNEFLWMDQIKDFTPVNINKNKYYPRSDQKGNEKVFIDIYNYIHSEIEENNVLKIVYRNLKDEIFSRYILVSSIIDSTKTGGKEESFRYLLAHCFLRDAERLFRSDRILSIRPIENESLIAFLKSKTGQ